MFKSKKIYPIGLDISDYSLKYIQLVFQRGKIHIASMGKSDIPKGLIENGEILRKGEVAKAIKNMFANPKFGKPLGEEVAVCLPETKSFIKLLDIEKSMNDLSAMIEPEMEKYIPFSVNEIYYDWQTMGEDQSKYEVLVGAAPRSIISSYSDMLKEAGYLPIAFEIESESISRCLIAEESPQYKKSPVTNNYLVIDFGARRTSIFAYSKNTVLFDISMPISGDEITDQISKILDITWEQAEKAKIICGLDKDKANGIVYKMLSGKIADLIARLRTTISFYENHYPQRGPINKILLSGGGANIINLDKIIMNELKIETELGDSLINLKSSPEIVKTLTEKHSLNFITKENQTPNEISITQNAKLTYATAIGLALRGMFIKTF